MALTRSAATRIFREKQSADDDIGNNRNGEKTTTPVSEDGNLLISRYVSFDGEIKMVPYNPIHGSKGDNSIGSAGDTRAPTASELKETSSSFWDTKEANNLFRPWGSETPRQAVESMIDLLDNFIYAEDRMQPGGDVEVKAVCVQLALELAYDDIEEDKLPSFCNPIGWFSMATMCKSAAKLYADDFARYHSNSTSVSGLIIHRWFGEFRECRIFPDRDFGDYLSVFMELAIRD